MGEEKKNLKIEIPFDNFQNHLDLEDNYRIIFSGIFGIGKTTFIKDFFKLDAEDKKKYEVIHLFPVNYSVANNEDIFELVKFDILLQLLTKNVVFDKVDLKTDLVLTQFVKDNFVEVLSPFLNFIPVIGGSLSKATDKLIKLRARYDKCKIELDDNQLKSATKFLDAFTKIKGNIYEEDFYTNLIQGLITQLKEKEKEKELILVIDDLDRIDPEHIFRLLNVFAAQVDINPIDEQENKFGFDKVIFVCDINNIRNIYKHKYGIETDFNGYIDKFYSREIFEFNAKEIINNYLYQILETVNEGKQILPTFDQNENPDFFRSLKYILSIMFSQSLINLRDLLRLYNRKDLSISPYNLRKIGYFHINNKSLIITQLYDSLNLIFGNNTKKLLETTHKCKVSVEHSTSEITNIIGNSLIILDVNNHQFKDVSLREDEIYTYENLQYKIITDSYSGRFRAVLKGNKADNSELNPFDYLYKSFVKIHETIK